MALNGRAAGVAAAALGPEGRLLRRWGVHGGRGGWLVGGEVLIGCGLRFGGCRW